MTRKKKTANLDKNKIIVIFAVAAVIILGTVLWSVISLSAPDDAEILQEGTFGEMIEIAGVDVSGKTALEAEPLIRAKAEEMLGQIGATYSVLGTEYRMTAYQMGAYVDLEPVMKEAMLYKKTKEEKETVISFEIAPKLNMETLTASLEEYGKFYNTDPVNATIKVVTDQDEEKLSCSGVVEYSESVVGVKVDAAALAEKIRAAVEDKVGSMPIVVEPQLTEPALSAEAVQKNCTLMAEYETTFKDSGYGRRYNIWKMSTVVNGVVLQPGEIWSINEAAGDRTTANGWADAKGIKNGAYVDEPGGGICQVSSTLYNAILRSEVTVVERKHHSWPLKYVDVGLDATISTGAPDFVISNPYEHPIAIVANTDAKDARKVKVSIYGPEMDYKLDFKSTIVKETEPEPYKTAYDPLMTPGTSAETSPRKIGLTVEITKHWYDKETGEEIKSELYYTDTYRAFPGTITYGPSPSPSPSASPEASADAGAEQTQKPSAEQQAPAEQE